LEDGKQLGAALATNHLDCRRNSTCNVYDLYKWELAAQANGAPGGIEWIGLRFCDHFFNATAPPRECTTILSPRVAIVSPCG
jgi:hypothetical protein